MTLFSSASQSMAKCLDILSPILMICYWLPRIIFCRQMNGLCVPNVYEDDNIITILYQANSNTSNINVFILIKNTM